MSNKKRYFVLNIGLSLLPSVKIIVMNKLPYEMVGMFLVSQLICPLVASGGILEPSEK